MESTSNFELNAVPDDELLRRLADLVSRSRRVEADLVAHIGEVDQRRLFARFAFPSMFAYCTDGLHLSEAEAYRRITVARASRRYPMILAALQGGRIHLSGLAALVPLLTAENCAQLLERATHRTKRQIEELVAELAPRPDAAGKIRRLPEPKVPSSIERVADIELVPGRVQVEAEMAVVPLASPAAQAPATSAAAAPAPATLAPATPAPITAPSSSLKGYAPPAVEALSPGRYKVQFTASAALRDKIERLTALLRSEVPDGDLATVIDRAVSRTLERLEARRFAKTNAPRQALGNTDVAPTSRHIPAAVRRVVAARDQGRCRFVDEQGRRCSERHRLQFHHRRPFGMGGDHGTANISLMCAQHNRRLAEHDYGQARIGRSMKPKGPPGPATR